MNGMKVKVSDSLDNVPNEHVVTTGNGQPTNSLTKTITLHIVHCRQADHPSDPW